METKPLVASATAWAALIAFVPIVSQVLDTVINSGIELPPKAAAIVSAVSGFLVILRRWTNKDTKPVKGIINAQ